MLTKQQDKRHIGCLKLDTHVKWDLEQVIKIPEQETFVHRMMRSGSISVSITDIVKTEEMVSYTLTNIVWWNDLTNWTVEKPKLG